jgi:hypothetical protein
MAKIFDTRILHLRFLKRKSMSIFASASLLASPLTTLLSTLIAPLAFPPPAQAVETWEKLDKRMKGQVVQLSVGLKMKIKDSLCASLADVSPKHRYPPSSALQRATQAIEWYHTAQLFR